MKIRIPGSADLVRGWQKILEAEYGQPGRIYNSRGSNDLRLYMDIDDRTAENILNRSKPSDKKTVVAK